VAHHASINCFNDFDADGARETARNVDLRRRSGAALRPLDGVPISLKDNIDTRNMLTTAGTPALRHHRPPNDAPVVDRLIQAGAIMLGKNGMHELSFGITSNNATFGAVHNPSDPSMIPGGSSGGTAAAVAAKLVPAGIGTDTGGSVRIPASLCGTWGFRPTTGRWPQTGIVPISYTRDTAGPLARNVDDLMALDLAVTGGSSTFSPRSIQTIRLGVPRAHFWDDLEDEVRSCCEAALQSLQASGATLVEIDVSDVVPIDALSSFVVTLYEIEPAMSAYLARDRLALRFCDIAEAAGSPDVRALLATALDPEKTVTKAAYMAAIQQHRPRLLRTYNEHFVRHGVDAFVFPTCPLSARPIGQDDFVELNGRKVPTFAAFMRNTGPGSNADLPGLTIPVGETAAGLPIGLALDAPAGSDHALLVIGQRLGPVLATSL